MKIVGTPHRITTAESRRLWLRAQRLDEKTPFGSGTAATQRAIEHLGYVQIDTINVVERCHHHILYSRIPTYRREHLRQAQTEDRSVFEYWTHALAYIPRRDVQFYFSDMKRHKEAPLSWFKTVTAADLRKVVTRIRKHGPLTIRDIDDDELTDETHPWAGRKPSRRALQLAFFRGEITVRERVGMLKSYELLNRHFNWNVRPRPASDRQIAEYLLDRASRSQGIVSINSICYLNARRKPQVRALIDERVKRNRLVPIKINDLDRSEHWIEPQALELVHEPDRTLVHVLSPFDPLVIQRGRLAQFFGYEHRFEAYLPQHRRIFGYFALPVLIGDEIVAAIDLKADRQARKLHIQKWNWLTTDRARHMRAIDEALHRFEVFQLS